MIVAALLARNEAGEDRYLTRCVKNALRYCDAIVCVDDHSHDHTASLVRRAASMVGKPAVVVPAVSDSGFWGKNETAVRAQLWDLAQVVAGDDGWIYVFDADHELLEISPEDVRLLTASQAVNAWAFPLWDCWDSDQRMRVDGFWQAHLHPRPWLFKARPTPEFVPHWDAKAIHCGHVPHNYPLQAGIAPGLAGIRHLGYVHPEARQKKHRQYTEVTALSDAERAHAESIADPEPTLAPIPPNQHPKVLIASVVRKPAVVLDAFLKSLQWQRLEHGAFDLAFIANFADTDPYKNEALAVLHKYQVALAPAPPNDYGDGAVTRQWTNSAFKRMAELKDSLMRKAVEEGYSHIWLVDADVNCDPYTLQTLLDANAPIVSAVYWTNWMLPTVESEVFVHAGPQVWQRGAYAMDSVLMTAEEFREKLINRERLQVGGLGACTLIRADAIIKGASFSFFRENPMGGGGMADGEDRHFCARAKALHLPLVADAWSDVYHAYHPSEYDKLPTMIARLQPKHPDTASHGDLVSVLIEALEPVDDAARRRILPAPQYLRGRLGSLPVLPEIEEAVYGLTRRDSMLVKVRFPAHYEVASMRGSTRIMRLTLLDCKPFAYAPVIEQELFVATQSKRYLDSVTLTPEQVGSLVGEING